jgi:hypothetical protein
LSITPPYRVASSGRAPSSSSAGLHRGRSEPALVLVGLGPARHREHAVAAARQHRHRGRAHPAGRPGHHDLSLVRSLTVQLHAGDGEAGGEPGRAQDHRLAQGEAGGERDDPVARHAQPLGEAAVVALAEAHAVHEHGVARTEARVLRGFDDPRRVDPVVGQLLDLPRPVTLGAP